MTVTIYGELHSSKNGKDIVKINGRFLLISKKPVREAEKDIIAQLGANKLGWQKMCEGKSFPLSVSFKIYRKTRRRFDYINIVQQLFDCMVKCHWLADDSADYIIPVFLPYDIDKNQPRVEITVL